MTQERTSWLDKKWKEKTKKGERTERQNKTKSGEEEKKKFKNWVKAEIKIHETRSGPIKNRIV